MAMDQTVPNGCVSKSNWSEKSLDIRKMDFEMADSDFLAPVLRAAFWLAL
jgi:hypothetical protein